MNEFEQKLQGQPLRQIPHEWRAEILAAANQAQAVPQVATIPRASFLSTVRRQLATLLWPNQLAWGGLAVIWIFIFALQFSLHDHSSNSNPSALAQHVAPPSPEVVAQLRQQQRMFAELMEAGENNDADRPKNYLPRPRSQCMEMVAV